MAVLPGSSGQVPESGNDPSLGGVKWMQDVTEQGVKDRAYNQVFPSMQGAKNSLFGSFIGGIFGGFLNIFRGGSGASWLPSSVSETAIEIRDGQIDLKDRADLLEGVRGYAAAYQTKNVYTGYTQEVIPGFPWWTSNRVAQRMLPFGGQVGPSKGATVDTNGIRFDEPGLWLVFLMCRRHGGGTPAATTSAKDSTDSQVFMNIMTPNGDVYSPKEINLSNFSISTIGDTRVGIDAANPITVTASIPVVVPEPGMTVAISVKDTRARWWMGGTRYSMLAVVKQDSRTENPGQETVPSETG